MKMIVEGLMVSMQLKNRNGLTIHDHKGAHGSPPEYPEETCQRRNYTHKLFGIIDDPG